MGEQFKPDLSVLNEGQRTLWQELSEEVPPGFVLCGGTAIALQLGHRSSIDFDFFGCREFDPDDLYGQLKILKGSRVNQKSANTLSCWVERGEDIQVSFFGVPQLEFIGPQVVSAMGGVPVASLIDLVGLKMAVVQKRAEAKDYLDIDAILQRTEIDLPIALAAGKMLYKDAFNPLITLKALCWFEDGNVSTIPEETKARLSSAAARVNPEEVSVVIPDQWRRVSKREGGE